MPNFKKLFVLTTFLAYLSLCLAQYSNGLTHRLERRSNENLPSTEGKDVRIELTKELKDKLKAKFVGKVYTTEKSKNKNQVNDGDFVKGLTFRVLKKDGFVTMDYRHNRVNLILDENSVITQVRYF